MNRPLNDIIEELNFRINRELIGYKKKKFYKQAYLQEQNDNTFPLVNEGSRQGKQISWNDNFNLQIYWRLLDSELETDENNGKGGRPYRYNVMTVRMVGLGLQEKRNKKYEVNQDVMMDVLKGIPSVTFEKEWVNINDQNIDKLSVLNEEFSGNDFQRLSLENIAFYIDLNIRQKIICQ